MSTLEKRNQNLWKLYNQIIKHRDIIESKTYWHQGGWSSASETQIDQARQELCSVLEKFRNQVARIPESEIRSWKEFEYLAAFGLFEFEPIKKKTLKHLKALFEGFLPDYLE